jgi:glucose 1-dehydrogenase
MDKKLDGQVAIVTGSDSGIGRAIAIEFATHGADVAVTWLHDEAGAQSTAREIETQGRRALVLQLDVRDPDEIAALFKATQDALGTPFILVNDAGVGGGGLVAEMTIADFDNVLKTNLYGPFYACQHFVRTRREAGGRGKIINISSVHEEIPMPGSAAYCASKGALRNFTRCLALEVAGDRINVNNIAPGMIKTPMNKDAIEDPKKMEQAVQHIPWKRAGEPEEIAHIALYLASPDSDYATGQTFTIDGGLTMNQGQGA